MAAVFAAGSLAACASVSEDGKHWIDPGGDASADEIAVTQHALTGEHKLCRIVSPSNWSDTIVVPNNWTWDDCSAFGTAFSATKYALGCVTNSGHVINATLTNLGTSSTAPGGCSVSW